MNLEEWQGRQRKNMGASSTLSGEELAKAVLEAKDRYTLLSLGSAVELKVDKEGYLNVDDADVRRAYLKISQKIHPDKLPHYSGATRCLAAIR